MTYSKTLHHAYDALKDKRAALQNGLVIISVISIIFGLIYQNFGFTRGLAACFAIPGVAILTLNHVYKDFYNKTLISSIFKELYTDYCWHQEKTLDYKGILRTGILPYHDNKKLGNLITFKASDIPVKMSNLMLFKKVYRSEEVMFDGCFIRFELPKLSKATLLIRTKERIGPERLKDHKLEKLDVIAPELNTMVSMYTDDQIASRKILQPATLKKLQDMLQRYNMHISIVDNEVNIAIHGFKLTFKPNSFLSLPKGLDAPVKKIRASLNAINELIETLNFHQTCH